MRKPICPHCDKPIRPTYGTDCPNCGVSYHKKCIRNVTHCLTCAAELAPKERPPLKPGESLRIPDTRLVDLLRPYLRAVGLTLTGTSPFLFLFWKDSLLYPLAVAAGLALVGLAQLLPRFVRTAHVLQPARQRQANTGWPLTGPAEWSAPSPRPVGRDWAPCPDWHRRCASKSCCGHRT